jgi:cytidine deaminase
MMKAQFIIEYEELDSFDELNPDDAELLQKARQATNKAYAPYSSFRVGAAARLINGQFVEGSNQENASFPAGLCAERVMLSTISSLYPDIAISSMAVSYSQPIGISDEPIAPCGICRQTLQEYEARFGKPFRLILGGMEGRVLIFAAASDLLPMAFSKSSMH